MNASDLTESYIHEVVKRIPADQRTDVADELRTTIADTVDARDTDPAAAEREVLTEMGDPILLAARYADRPLALIGPRFYPTYLRILVLLLSTVLPIVVVVMVMLDVVDHHDVGSAIGAGFAAVLTVGGQMIAWLTVVFALIDRAAARDGSADEPAPWTPDRLPETPAKKSGERVELRACAGAVWHAFLIGVIVWQYLAEPFPTPHGHSPVLDPALWTGWIWPILAGLVGLLAVDVWQAAVRRPTLRSATWFASASAVFALPLAWILYRNEFFDPRFFAVMRTSYSDQFGPAAAAVVLVVTGLGVLKRVRTVRR